MTKIASEFCYLGTLFLVGFNIIVDFQLLKSSILFFFTMILILVRIRYYLKLSKSIEDDNKVFVKKNYNLKNKILYIIKSFLKNK